MEYKKRILVTGGAGFIGSHLVRHFVNKYPEYLIVVYDALTYAGDLENFKDVLDKENLPNKYQIRELLFRRLVSQLQQFLLRQILRRNRLHRKQQQNKKPYHLSHSDLRLFSLVTSISRI